MRRTKRRAFSTTGDPQEFLDSILDPDSPEEEPEGAQGYLATLRSGNLTHKILTGIDYSFITQKFKNKWARRIFTNDTIPFMLIGTFHAGKTLWNQIHSPNQITVTINELNQRQAFGAILTYLQSETSYFKEYLDQLDMEGTLFYDYINQQTLPSNNAESTKKFNRTKALAKEFIDAHLPDNYVNTIEYAGKQLRIEKVDKTEQSTGNGATVIKNESNFSITAKKEDKGALTQFLNEVVNFAYENWLKSKTSVFTPGNHGWVWHNELASRPLESVFIPHNQKTEILQDLERFKKTKNTLLKKGLNIHRSYLFHGVPGSGKTTFIKALATYLDRNVYFLPLGSELSNKDLNNLLSDMEEESILVLEEIDVVFDKREASKHNKVSFDVLLNMLDGLIAKKNLITFITTNHYDKIDPALLRAGRVSMELQFGYIQEKEILKMVEYWYNIVFNVETKKFILHYLQPGKYRASLIESFIMRCADWEEFLEKLPTFGEYVKLNHASDYLK